MAAAPRPQQPPPQSGGNVNLQPGGGCAGAGAGGGGQQQPQGPAAPGGQEAAGPAELSRPQHYTIPGILHYIQHEWARFEMERAHWEVERAELQARIAFLQGERKGQENLKKDLVRRIKMLEYALKQERAKYHKLKYGTELNQGDLKMPTFESGDFYDITCSRAICTVLDLLSLLQLSLFFPLDYITEEKKSRKSFILGKYFFISKS